MRSLTTFFALMVIFMAPGLLVHAQSIESASPANGSSPVGAPAEGATKQEVNQLRNELAAQRKTIEELKALVERLAGEKAATADNGSVQIRPAAASLESSSQPPSFSAEGVRLRNAVLLEADPLPAAAVVDQAPAVAAPKKDTPLAAGWNGEHFFIRSADGQFTISPYGYVNTDYRAYQGDGAPSDTFLLRNARFGFQGSYGSHFDFALLTDASSTTGSIVRDVYLNIRYKPELQFQAGQFKTPFAQETGIGDTNLDFVERGFQSMLYPSAATTYRSPGAVLHGDIDGGVVQYWLAAFAFIRGANPRAAGSRSLPSADPSTTPGRAVFPAIKASVPRYPMALTPFSRSSPLTAISSATTASSPTSS